MTVRELSLAIRAALTPRFGRGEAEAMERIIMEKVMRLNRVEALLRADSEVPDFMPGKVAAITDRIAAGEPIQYVLGTARFCGMELKVTPAVLIPRPETEQLVDMVCDAAGSRADLRVLDCGTGSGCIAIALARALRFPQVTAVDLSQDALAVARDNAAALGADVAFVHADLLRADTMPAGASYDVIVSNPPYVLRGESAAMEPHVLLHEPHMALFVPDDDPLRFYRAILDYAASALAADGTVYFEINPLEADGMAALARQCGFGRTDIIADLHGRKRFAIISRS